MAYAELNELTFAMLVILWRGGTQAYTVQAYTGSVTSWQHLQYNSSVTLTTIPDGSGSGSLGALVNPSGS